MDPYAIQKILLSLLFSWSVNLYFITLTLLGSLLANANV